MQNKRFLGENDLRHWSKVESDKKSHFYSSMSLIIGTGSIFLILIVIALITM